jgi:hypothetical protein
VACEMKGKEVTLEEEREKVNTFLLVWREKGVFFRVLWNGKVGDESQYEKLYMDGGREEMVNEGVHAIIVITPARVSLRSLNSCKKNNIPAFPLNNL